MIISIVGKKLIIKSVDGKALKLKGRTDLGDVKSVEVDWSNEGELQLLTDPVLNIPLTNIDGSGLHMAMLNDNDREAIRAGLLALAQLKDSSNARNAMLDAAKVVGGDLRSVYNAQKLRELARHIEDSRPADVGVDMASDDDDVTLTSVISVSKVEKKPDEKSPELDKPKEPEAASTDKKPAVVQPAKLVPSSSIRPGAVLVDRSKSEE
jgi:hypothetical protein